MLKLTQLIFSNILSTEQAIPLEDALDMHDLYDGTDLRDNFEEILRVAVTSADVQTNLLTVAVTTTRELGLRLGIHFTSDVLLTKMCSILRTLKTVVDLDVELKQELFFNMPEGNRIVKLESILRDYTIDEIGILTDHVIHIEKSFMDMMIAMLNVEDNESSATLDNVLEIRDILNEENIPLDKLMRVVSDVDGFVGMGDISEDMYHKYLSEYIEDTIVFVTTALSILSVDKYNDYHTHIRPRLQANHVKRLDELYGLSYTDTFGEKYV